MFWFAPLIYGYDHRIRWLQCNNLIAHTVLYSWTVDNTSSKALVHTRSADVSLNTNCKEWLWTCEVSRELPRRGWCRMSTKLLIRWRIPLKLHCVKENITQKKSAPSSVKQFKGKSMWKDFSLYLRYCTADLALWTKSRKRNTATVVSDYTGLSNWYNTFTN